MTPTEKQPMVITYSTTDAAGAEIYRLRDELQAANLRAEKAERDAKENAVVASDLINLIRDNNLRPMMALANNNQLENFLKPYAERIIT